MWLKSTSIDCLHGFSTRHGGVSTGVFSSLNLGGSDDDPENIRTNRTIALNDLGLSLENVCMLKQVHGSMVCEAQTGKQEGDALVTDEKGKILVVAAADCFPVLFHDAVSGVAAAAHAGWRGIRGGIVQNTISAMTRLGADIDNIRIAVGPGIDTRHFEVGDEVRQQFKNAGFPETCFAGRNLDLLQSILFILSNERIPAKNVHALKLSSYDGDFYSHRRDKGLTGRMWGLIVIEK